MTPEKTETLKKLRASVGQLSTTTLRQLEKSLPVVQPAELRRALRPGHGGPERHRRVRHLVRAPQLAVVDPLRRLRHRPDRADPVHQPAEGPPAHPDRGGGGGGPGPGDRPGGGPALPARGRAAVLPRGRVRRRRCLRPRRRIPRLLGHPAGSADRGRHPARRKHRRPAVPDRRPGLEGAGALHRHGGQFAVGTQRQLRQRTAPHGRPLRRGRAGGHPGRPADPDPRRRPRTGRRPT